ncbi:YheT family hydrolase [Reichenbachiella versicolor]|uniref:YheT family hydrolase n=1 Tax=Reichenbachiella versicolor TaxID=1821036 RepID=UPI000D6E4680|nr:alpha/beta fold hydrolase [Reichenbachiella versicolor]
MPLIKGSSYRRPSLLCNAHLETVIPSLTRKFNLLIRKSRVKVKTPDDDFLLVDEYNTSSRKAVIISHGLEGDSERPYVLGMVNRFIREEYNVYAWNFRGCGGELNKVARMYHSGATYDLETIVSYVCAKNYETVSVIGFSLGGNLTLKYLGEYSYPENLKSAVAISVPLDLAGCSNQIDSPKNAFYARRFLISLTEKTTRKREQMPHILPHLKKIKFNSLFQFDDLVTAPLHGFDGADHYYASNSSISFIDKIKIPTLVINAKNDPFLSDSCLDPSYFKSSENVYFEMPKFGGHVGFYTFGQDNVFWSEERALRFITLQDRL